MSKRLFSGIQPSGNLHLGNYLGAIKQWVALQEDNEAIFCVVDLHAITVPQDPEELRKKTLEVVKIYLAAGIDPKKVTLFVQSHVKEHTELAWILNTITKNGDLTKMTQFKDKANYHEELFEPAMVERSEQGIKGLNLEIKDGSYSKDQVTAIVNTIRSAATIATVETYKKFIKETFNSSTVGLFTYPVLMAADILLYDTNVVPVGKDQMQHIELARDLAERFNKHFGETFVIPEGKLSKEGALIMGLDDPSKKMSKSAPSEYNYIALTDDAETVRKKIKKAVTDSGSEIVYSDDKPALKNLINIYSLLSGKSPEEVVVLYSDGPDSAKASTGKYGIFKTDLAEVVVNFLTPFQERLASISDEVALSILATGAEKARALAEAKMKQVRERVGFLA